MTNKLIFIDVDGTLCNDYGMVPSSAKLAIQKAQANGHQIYLCTGRSKAEITEEIAALPFDGMIGAGGGYIETKAGILYHETFNEADLQAIVHFFNENKIGYYLESNHGLFKSQYCVSEMEKQMYSGLDPASEAYQKLKEGTKGFFDLLQPEPPFEELTDVNKISFIHATYPFQEVADRFGDRFTIMQTTVPAFGQNSGEIVLPGINKELAIIRLLEYLERPKTDTIAIGDGHNDLEMLQFVNYGVAMGNAQEALKQVADEITETHDEDGIHNFFERYGLI
ncbi:HAD family hydrolase [Listeria ilorinensis]|uniref:HAD family hydrolase n=1 Tax=Listeria ilorinensis TaxID=2867439 RepID=UPI001EF706C9|nr:HAD family hydrolase [Listeria ilorinensis]